MKILILKLIIIVWICLSITIVVGSKNKKFSKKVIVTETDIGDLYRASKLKYFEEIIINYEYVEDTSLQNADIILAGDSFFKATSESDTFANLLESEMDIKVSNILKKNSFILCNPSKLLVENEYNSIKKKILILETIERGAYYYGLKYYTDELNIRKETEFQRKKNLMFGDKKMKYLFTNNIFLFHINNFVKQLRFTLLKEPISSIGKYSIEQKMLFHNDGTEFYEENKNKKVINKAVDFISQLKANLKEKYNIEMVFMIIPDKFTIYKDFVEDSAEYDEFIPKFQNKLDEAGIMYIDIFSKYVEYRREDDSELLYYRSDTHFTPLGKQIVVDETVKFILENKLLDEKDD